MPGNIPDEQLQHIFSYCKQSRYIVKHGLILAAFIRPVTFFFSSIGLGTQWPPANYESKER